MYSDSEEYIDAAGFFLINQYALSGNVASCHVQECIKRDLISGQRKGLLDAK